MEEELDPKFVAIVQLTQGIIIYLCIFGVIFFSIKSISPSHSLFRVIVLFAFLHYFDWNFKNHLKAIELFYIRETNFIRIAIFSVRFLGFISMLTLLIIIWIKFTFLYSIITLMTTLLGSMILSGIQGLFGLNKYGRYFTLIGLSAVPVLIISIFVMLFKFPVLL